jgi:hypothetical protein
LYFFNFFLFNIFLFVFLVFSLQVIGSDHDYHFVHHALPHARTKRSVLHTRQLKADPLVSSKPHAIVLAGNSFMQLPLHVIDMYCATLFFFNFVPQPSPSNVFTSILYLYINTVYFV